MHRKRHPALARRRHAGVDVDPGEGDAERAQACAAREFDGEEEFVQAGGLAQSVDNRPLAEGHAEMQVGHQAEAPRAKHQLAVERDVEIALVVEESACRHRNQAEEVHAGIEAHLPGAHALVAHLQHEAGIELEHLQELDLAVQGNQETVGLHGDAGQRPCRARGVQLQLAARLDLDDLEQVGVDVHIEHQRQARPAVGVDAGATARVDGDGSQRERDVELDRKHVALQRYRDAARGRDEAQEGDRPVDIELEAGQHRHGRAVGLGQHLLRERADVDFQGRTGLERQADVAAETAAQADVDVGGEAVAVDTQHAVDVERADAEERHAGLGADFDGEGVGREDEFEAPADIDHRAQLQLPLQHQAQARVDRHVAEQE